jgi:hypothetical protein
MRGRAVGDERLTLQHVKANAAELVDVGVVDLGEETDLWGRHWVIIWEEEFEVEDATWDVLVWFKPGKPRQDATYPHKAIV